MDTVVFKTMEEYDDDDDDDDDGYGDDGKQQGAFSVIMCILGYLQVGYFGPQSQTRSTITDSAVSSTNIGVSPLRSTITNCDPQSHTRT